MNNNPVRAIFLNQGAGGDAVLGHLTTEAILRPRLEAAEEIEAQFFRLPALRGLAGHAVRPVPGLASLDLDLQPLRWHAVQAWRARRIVLDAHAHQHADVVHLHSHVLAFALGPLMERIPTVLSVDAPVWEVHAMGIWRPVRRYSRATVAPSMALERRAFSRAAAVLAWSKWARRGIEGVCPDARVVDHHPGIDTRLYQPAPRSDHRVPRVLFVGGRFEQKGGADTVSALSPALDRGEVELDVVTKSPVVLRPGVRVHRLSAQDPGLIRLYQECDVFSFPSHADACPWTVLEAMACGAAVVASDVGGTPELVDYGRAGLTVTPRRVAELRLALQGLIDDPVRRSELGRSARKRVEEHYDADRNTSSMVRLFSQLASSAAPPGDGSANGRL